MPLFLLLSSSLTRNESLVNVKEGARNEWSTKKILAAPSSGSFFFRDCRSIRGKRVSRFETSLERVDEESSFWNISLDHPRSFFSFSQPRATFRIYPGNKCWKQLYQDVNLLDRNAKFCSLATLRKKARERLMMLPLAIFAFWQTLRTNHSFP